VATGAEAAGWEVRRLEEIWSRPPGLSGWARAANSSYLGKRLMVTAFAFFLLGGVLALLMRTQLAVPENELIGSDLYNRLFTMHGTTMLFLFAVPMAEGLFTFLVPGMLGARDLPFPRLNAFSYWTYLAGGLVLYAGLFLGLMPATGWFSYTPLSLPEFSPSKAMDLWLIGITLTEISAIAFAIDMITAVFRFRAPGMSINRMPLFAWGALVVAFLILFGFPPVIVASLFLEAERLWLWPFYDASRGGDPLLWQHLFWIFGHPEVYIIFIPGAAIVDTLIPTFTRRPVVGYPLLAASLVSTAVLGMGVWVHHMFATGLPGISLAFFAAASMAVSVPSALQIFCWLATIWTGRPVLRTPFLFVIGFVLIFVIGGLSGVLLAMVPFDWQVHDTYFVVAHFHYVLIGGMVFPLFAGLYYWYSHWTGRQMSERLGRWNFWLMFLGFNLAFFPMHNSGLLGMPRRIYTYSAEMGWSLPNLLSTAGAYLFAVGVLLFLVNWFSSLRRGPVAGHNPWNAPEVDWSGPLPLPPYEHRSIPSVSSRYPLWQEPEIEAEIEEGRGWLATPSDHHQETLATTPLDAAPEQVIRLPARTLWHLWAALSLTVLLLSLLGPLYWLTAPAATALVWTVWRWLWPTPETAPYATEEREGLPVNLGGRRSTIWWGALLFQGANLTGFWMVVFSYFYLRNRAAEWPPPGLPYPEFLSPALAAVALLLASATFFWLVRRPDRAAGRGGALGLAGTLGLSVAALGLIGGHAVGYAAAGVLPQDTGYAATYYAMVAYVGLNVLVLVLLAGATVVRARQETLRERRHAIVDVTALHGWTVTAMWLVALLVLFGSPLGW
jgi:cytochrome c oxidase subunit I+III